METVDIAYGTGRHSGAALGPTGPAEAVVAQGDKGRCRQTVAQVPDGQRDMLIRHRAEPRERRNVP
ncbi:hypothetical protein [Streptomyces sp. S.PB5]|uniref:hypothetical protein n=1 Tax=Streptomyces sp. S.PB5 TaxID=3020844 RepID=UPI0025B149E2|nr:hypothetical protein [Streptomyces sp. S.PB5]MDN3024454.1 hypothetical protein [Streptomyces sp. S.PB5]